MSEIQNFTNVLDELETSMINKINMVMSEKRRASIVTTAILCRLSNFNLKIM